MADDYHLSLSLTNELWQQLLSAALPVQLATGTYDVVRDTRRLISQLEVRRRVAGLMDERNPPRALIRVRDRARDLWKSRKDGVRRRLHDLVQVDGTWVVELDGLGTDLAYANQQVSADAFIRAAADGRVQLLKENVDIPFHVERRIGVSVALGRIRYSPGHDAVVGNVQDLAVHLGDHLVLQLVARLVEYGLDTKLPTTDPVTILKKDQVSGLLSPMGGMFRVDMDVDELAMDVDHDTLTLKVRFGFSHPQLTAESPPN